MRPFHRLIVSTATSIALAAPAGAQAARPARYLVPRDTLRYEIDNPFRLYWVRGADTIGPARRERSVESHRWRGPEKRPEVVIRQVTLDVLRRTATDTFTLSPTGRVDSVNHRPPTGAHRVDLLLQLPASSPLPVGARWSDTVRATGADPRGPHEWYEVRRSYRVARRVDTLGVRGVADVAAEGTVHMRFGYWVDSAAGRIAWVDVTGPVTERYLFDVERGRLLRRQWTMDLRGRGVGPTAPDTLAAGLRSEETMVLVDSPRLRFVLEPLPGDVTDITFAAEGSAALLRHTVARSPDRITSSLTRNDAMVGVATATMTQNGLPRGYTATWSDSAGAMQTQRVVPRPDSRLLLQRTGRPDTTLAPPKSGSAWGVADYAMEELLVPVLLAIPRDGEPHPVSILRPFPGHWDEGTVTARGQGEFVVLVLGFGKEEDSETILLTTDGDLLLIESGQPAKSRRVAIDEARNARLRRSFQELMGH